MLADFIRRQPNPTTRRIIVAVALALFLAYPTYKVVRGLTAQQVSAHVDHCTAGRTVSCYGGWRTPGGESVSGRIDGAHSRDIGHDVPAWASGGSATTNLFLWYLWGLLYLPLIILAGIVLVIRYRNTKGRPGR